MRKHTICRLGGKKTQSVHHSESILRDHVLSVGQNTRRHDEWIFLHLSDEITYFLVRKYETPWAQNFALIPRDYWLPVGGNTNTRGDHEHNILHQSDEITYQLWTKTQHNTIIRPLFVHPTRSRMVCGRNTLKHHEHITLHRSDPITYNLWAKTQGETMSTFSWSIRRNYAHPVCDKMISTESAPSNGNTHHLLLWVDIWMTLLVLLLQKLVHYYILVVVQSAIRGDGEDKRWGGVPAEHWSFKVDMCPSSC